MYLSLYCKGSKRVTQGLRVKGSWRPNRNCNILISTLMAVNVVSFSFSICSTGGPEAHSVGDGFLYCILSASSLDPNSSGLLEGPFGRVWLSLPHSSITVSNSTATATRTQLSYMIVQRPLDRPLDIWNRMFNRHQAEITVMQFRGHSLPVRQSMRISWDFLARPISSANFRPRDFLS